VRELLFRLPDKREADEIVDLLRTELLWDVAGNEGDYDGLADHVYAFMDTVTSFPPLGMPAGEQPAEETPVPAQGTQTVSEPDRLSTLWESALTYEHEGNLSRAHQAAHEALRSGLYRKDAARARSLLTLATRSATRGACTREEYESTIKDAFSTVGPDRAYLDLLKIEEGMSRAESALWIETIVRLFYKWHDNDWIYVDEDPGKKSVPSVAPLVSKLSPYLPLQPFRPEDAHEMGF
jgi:hypothetical protein